MGILCPALFTHCIDISENPLVFFFFPFFFFFPLLFFSHLHHLLHCLLLLLHRLLCFLLLLHCHPLHHLLLHLYVFMGEGICTGISQNKSQELIAQNHCVFMQDSLFYSCFWSNFPSLRIQVIEQGRGEKMSLSHFVLNLKVLLQLWYFRKIVEWHIVSLILAVVSQNILYLVTIRIPKSRKTFLISQRNLGLLHPKQFFPEPHSYWKIKGIVVFPHLPLSKNLSFSEQKLTKETKSD